MLRKLYTAIAIMVSLSACDKIDENERYIDAKMPDVGRKVLVEEYTGQFCVNCPSGHEMMENIKSVFKENVVVVSIHAGQLSSDVPGYGLKTPEGDRYADAFKVDAYPSIVVDHKDNAISNIAQWQDAVHKCMGQNTSVDIRLSAHVSEDGNSLNVTTDLMSNTNHSAMCQVWVTESNIVTFQMELSGQANQNYVHNHVYRASVNGVGGEAVTLKSNEYTNKSYSIPISKEWNIGNLSVIAFVYDGSGVLQVEEIKLDTNK